MQPMTRMRGGRRHRWLPLSIFFIAYSVFQAAMTTPLTPDETLTSPQTIIKEASEKAQKDNVITTPRYETKENVELNTPNTDEKSKTSIKEEVTTEASKKKMKEAGYEEFHTLGSRSDQPSHTAPDHEHNDESITKLREQEIEENKLEDTVPTVHPLRNCTPPAIEQFPRPLMDQRARRHGGLILHILVAIFTFIGLAIVCDEYFVSSLDRICEELKLAPDVAGATFMAAGSSAPELATVVIGVFCAQDDIGVSGVIGSAVFNIMFVISVCALCAGTVSHLNWWPLCRDCFFYALSILVMLCTICNGYVSWPEALFMLFMYVVYCVALRFNTQLERWATALPLPFKLPTRDEQAALVTYKSAATTGAVGGAAAGGGEQYTAVDGQTNNAQKAPYNPDGAYENAAYNAEPAPVWDPAHSWDDRAWEQGSAPTAAPATNYGQDSWQQQEQQQQQLSPTQQTQPQQPPQPPKAVVPEYYKAKEYNPETAVDPLVKPIGANALQLAWWYIAWPVHWSCRHTMPDVRGRWYPVTFVISMLWISFYSYFMVWMITIIGYTLGIPDTVMGLTFVAAGVSVPDALSSLAVIKEGYGDMAVSNAVGSNVFDILVCLGLPWFIQTAIIQPGSHVNVISKGLIYSTLSLFSTVIFLVVATHANGWKLDRKFGAVLMVWYLLFITLASLYELNVFGNIHPPDCVSTY